MMMHAFNPRFLESRGRRITSSRLVWAKAAATYYLKN
jgi:hypothetical protein